MRSEALEPAALASVGKYQILRRLATGGMAEIYLAKSRGLEGFEKLLVLKKVLPQFAADPTFVRMFLNEARVAATLDHPNIATVYEIGQEQNKYFYTMEYLNGEDLAHVLRKATEQKKTVPLEHALAIVAGASSGLHFAHERRSNDGQPLGLVHRDVSPSNVVVTYDGGVKVVDFGLAKATLSSDKTGTGSLKGKIAYMSPEQCRGQDIDRRTDIFALGVLLYELTTMCRLFKAENEVATLRLVEESIIPPPSSRVPGYPPALEAIVLRCLAREPDARYATARELQIDLEEFAKASGHTGSAIKLGAWLENLCGPRRDPWSTSTDLPAFTGSGFGSQSKPAFERASLSVMTRTAPSRAEVKIEHRRTVRVVVTIALLTFLPFVAGVVAFHFGTRSTSLPPEPAVQIAVNDWRPDPARAAPPNPALPATGGPVGDARAKPATVTPSPAAVRRPRESGAQSLARVYSNAFGRKRAELSACFTASPAEAEHAGALAVHFEVEPDGHVTSADVLPPDQAATTLGKCIARVAGTAEFGPQPAAVSFKIPVLVRAAGGTRAP